MADLLPGYRVVKLLGTGARSKIYEAVELAGKRSVAIKHVLRETAEDERFLEQAETEYAVARQLDHPYLRRCLAMHRMRKLMVTKEICLVMELVGGLPLEEARPNRLNTFLVLFQRVTCGLQALHDKGYLHTDLKPSNIMLAPGGVLKIIDFGQACKIGQRKERIQGTPDYIAPEQVRKSALDEHTDVFNLGATMYWVLTSQTYPTEIRGKEVRGGVDLMSADRPLAPIDLNDKIPLSLSNLVMECCRAKPVDRPKNMKQVAARLATIQKIWLEYRESERVLRTITKSSQAPTEAAGDGGQGHG